MCNRFSIERWLALEYGGECLCGLHACLVPARLSWHWHATIRVAWRGVWVQSEIKLPQRMRDDCTRESLAPKTESKGKHRNNTTMRCSCIVVAPSNRHNTKVPLFEVTPKPRRTHFRLLFHYSPVWIVCRNVNIRRCPKSRSIGRWVHIIKRRGVLIKVLGWTLRANSARQRVSWRFAY